ncbi:nitrilase-related carbon-nitrogen hydrolase [Pontivivens ytuae]|uniref:Carbon-nitrogen hydrolase n=1 Tax=Pontivivens ytuae TaxID=2789856 RepID=A0A7S9QBK3_9RHOB|nr:nitrilase-related carbon-nitrogen hydrolase [Pontivivens ytuae]QPH53253.1 carbon-nitrogen hydrolase [Pontivivens ytuae]
MRIALFQTEPVSDPAIAAERLAAAAAEAASGGADILITPEMYLSGYTVGRTRLAELEAPIGEGVWKSAAKAACSAGIAVLAGGPEAGGFNSCALFDAGGAVVATCRKTHLYGDVDAAQFTPGEALAEVVAFGGLRLGLAICFDIEFPEVARTLTRRGAEAMLVPTANMHPYIGVPERLVPARAQENGVALAYANYCGADGVFDYCGRSCIVGADGDDLARAGEAPGLIFADITREGVTRVRADLDYLFQTRTELYE